MIVVLTGENSFGLRLSLEKVVKSADLEAERYEGGELSESSLLDMVQGQSLFSNQRLVIIDGVSQQNSLWSHLADILEKQSDETSLVLIEPSLDKRTSTYKWLTRHAKIIDHPWWKASESRLAEKWLTDFSEQHQANLPKSMVPEMVRRATRNDQKGKPIIDQQQLANAVYQLKNLSTVDSEALDAVLAPSTYENIFDLFLTALQKDTAKVQSMVRHLRLAEDGHRALGLLTSQVAGLAGLVLAGEDISVEQIARDTSSHPFALRQLVREANKLNRQQLGEIVQTVAEADVKLKTTAAEPWTLIGIALTKISQK